MICPRLLIRTGVTGMFCATLLSAPFWSSPSTSSEPSGALSASFVAAPHTNTARYTVRPVHEPPTFTVTVVAAYYYFEPAYIVARPPDVRASDEAGLRAEEAVRRARLELRNQAARNTLERLNTVLDPAPGSHRGGEH